MVGTALHALSILLLAAWTFRDRAPELRLAQAVLVGIAFPVLVLSVLARLGVDGGPASVLFAHAALWALAWSRRPRATGGTQPGSVLPVAALAGTIALLTALLGPDPSEIVLVDAWAHLAWSRDLAGSIESYARGFPAFVATLTPFDPLVGAFRGTAVVLHFGVAAQFLAFARGGSGRGFAALAALAYLSNPAASTRFEIPVPELLGALFLIATWWVLLREDLGERGRVLGLGALVLMIVLCHVSALQIAMLLGLGLAVVGGAGALPWGARLRAGAAMAIGLVVAAALSPSFLALLFAPESIPLMAMQSGSVQAIPPRSVVAGLGLTLGVLLAIALVGVVRRRRELRAREIVGFGGLAVAALLLLTPLALAHLEVELPLQLFTSRLLMAAALPLSILVAAVLGRGVHAGDTRLLLVALGAAVLAQVARPLAPLPQVAAALLVAAAVGVGLWRMPARLLPTLTSVVLLLAVFARLWIWTPEMRPYVQWLRDAPALLPVLTNWPVTNELDALLEVPVVDGLAGRDAGVALHRAEFSTALRDRLYWCTEEEARASVEGIRGYLESTGRTQAYLVVDTRFRRAWEEYADTWSDPTRDLGDAARRVYATEPCPIEVGERLDAVHRRLETWARAEVAFRSPAATVYHVRLPSPD